MKLLRIALIILSVLAVQYPAELIAAGGTTYEVPLDVFPSGGAKPISASFDHPRTSVGEIFGEGSTSPTYTLKTSGFISQAEIRYPYQPSGGTGYIDVQGVIDDDSATVTVVADNTVSATVDTGTFIARDVLLHEGLNTFQTTACDIWGNCATRSTSVTFDTILPSKPILNPVGTPTDMTPQLLGGSKEAGTAIRINGAEVVPNGAGTTWSYSYNLNEGHNPLSVTAVDLAGNQSAAATDDIILDRIPANIIITSPLDGIMVTSSPITLTGTVDDPDAAVVVSAVNNVNAGVSNGFFTAMSIQLAEGANIVTATATTPMGYVTSNQITVILDTASPSTFNVDPWVTPTGQPGQTVTGTKEIGANVLRNGVEVVPHNGATTWSDAVTLTAGSNVFFYSSEDAGGVEGPATMVSIFYDATAPTTPVVVDDGAYTTALTQLHASWSSNDPQTAIVDYEYAIGTTPQGQELVPYTSSGALTDVVRTGLVLTPGETYYFSVKATNAAGLTSSAGVSNGIAANSDLPVISALDPTEGAAYYEQDPVTVTVTASDAGGGALEYRYTVDGIVKQAWTTSSTYGLLIEDRDYGERIIGVEVRDEGGATAASQTRIFFMKKPKEPPAP